QVYVSVSLAESSRVPLNVWFTEGFAGIGSVVVVELTWLISVYTRLTGGCIGTLAVNVVDPVLVPLAVQVADSDGVTIVSPLVLVIEFSVAVDVTDPPACVPCVLAVVMPEV